MVRSRAGEPATTLKTVDRALRVLEIVAASPQPPLVRAVARELEHNVSSTYHLVNTLVGGGYLTKEPGGELALGPAIATLHAAYLRTLDVERQLRPFVERLAYGCGETVYLTRRIRDRVVIQTVVESTQSLRVTGLEPGFAGAEDRRASGKAVLAFLSPADRDAITRRAWVNLFDAERTVRRLRLDTELASVVESGYAFDNEEFEPGVCCISAPYFGANGEVLGSVTVSAPAVRLNALKGAIQDQLLRTAADITDTLRTPAPYPNRPA